MCQVTLDASDITAVTEKQRSNIVHLAGTLFGVAPLYASEVDKQLTVIAEQGPGAIAPSLAHAFLIGLQVGQNLPSANYPGRQFFMDVDKYDEVGEFYEDLEEYDEEEETELTFQSVRNS